MASSICSLCLCNCKEATSQSCKPHRIPDSDSVINTIIAAEIWFDFSGNKVFPSLSVIGQIWTLANGRWLSLVKQQLADAVIALVSFSILKCELVSDKGGTLEPRYIRSPCNMSH